jgi:hypothetical protein
MIGIFKLILTMVDFHTILLFNSFFFILVGYLICEILDHAFFSLLKHIPNIILGVVPM